MLRLPKMGAALRAVASWLVAWAMLLGPTGLGQAASLLGTSRAAACPCDEALDATGTSAQAASAPASLGAEGPAHAPMSGSAGCPGGAGPDATGCNQAGRSPGSCSGGCPNNAALDTSSAEPAERVLRPAPGQTANDAALDTTSAEQAGRTPESGSARCPGAAAAKTTASEAGEHAPDDCQDGCPDCSCCPLGPVLMLPETFAWRFPSLIAERSSALVAAPARGARTSVFRPPRLFT